jgi:hypothetical protein
VSRGRSFVAGLSARLASASLLAAGLMLGTAVVAQVPQNAAPGPNAGGPAWSSLSTAQQSALAPLKRDWQGIDAAPKQKWLEIAARFPAMPAEERQRIQDRMAEWARMSPDERGRARLQFQEARQISPLERQSRWDAYLALPVEERKALAKSASAVPPVVKPGSTPPAGKPADAALVSQNQKSSLGKVPSGQPVPKSIAPTVVQAKPGASTTLISKTADPPAHAQAGQPKIAATQGVVNGSTLLPQTGPQSQPAAAPTAAASASRR